MPETVESLQYELTANLAPLFAALEQGLKGVKDRINAFQKGDGKVDLTASFDQLLAQLTGANSKVKGWKKDTDRDAVVQPTVNPTGFMAGLTDLKGKAEAVARTLGGIFFAAAGFREIVSVFSGWTKASDEQEVALARLKSGLSASGAAGLAAFEPLKAQAEELARKYGQFGDEAIQSGQAVLASFKLTQNQIAALTPVLMDAATGLTKMGEGEVSLEQVAMLVGKALNGHAEALQRLGIQVDLARYKLDPLGATVAALNSRFQGLTAAVAATDAGKLKALAERWGEIKETLGDLVKSVLIPLSEALKPVITLFLSMPEPVRNAAIVIGVAAIAMKMMNGTLIELASRLLVFVDTIGAGAVAAVTRFGAAVVTLNWSQMTGGITAAAQSLSLFANNMSIAGKAILVVAAAWAGWQIGRWISDVTGLSAATATAAKMDNTWTEAELARFAAQFKAKTGIEMSADAMRIWIRLSAETRQGLIEETRATGDLRIGVEDLTRAMRAQLAAQADVARQALWADEKKQLDEYLAYYRSSRASQIATDIAGAEARVLAAKGNAEAEKKAQQELSQLMRQAAQEVVSQEQSSAQKAQQAWKQSVEAGKAYLAGIWKAITEGAAKAKADWADMSHSMAADMLQALDPTEYERAQVRIRAAEMERQAKSLFSGQNLAEQLVRIEQWKAEMIGQINDKQRQEEAAKAKEATDKAKADAERALQEAKTLFHQKVQAVLDPMGAMVKKAYATMSVAAATWAERVAGMMQPLSNAIQSLLMGMKVSWGNVLRQMAVTFLMQFVNKFLAWVAGMVVTWITGETVKTTASATGAAAQIASNESVAASNATVASSAMSAAVAEIWEAYAGIPYVGVASAIAATAIAMAVWGAATAAAVAGSVGAAALATGGLIDRPTFALMGEAGPELVAPAQDFKAVVGSLLASTVATVQLAAIGAGPAGGGGGAMGASTWEPHFHGFAFVDSGNRGYMRAAARKMASAMAAESRQRLAR